MMLRATLVVATLSLLGAGCSSVAYQKPVASLASGLDSLAKARATFSATYNQEEPNAQAMIRAKALEDGDPLLAVNCLDAAKQALNAAVSAESKGQSLDGLYAPGGAMASPAVCSVDLEAASPRTVDGTVRQKSIDFDAATAEAEAAADSATCAARSHSAVPPPPGVIDAAAHPQAQAADGDTLWKSVTAYTNGLSDLTDPTKNTSLSSATTATANEIGSAGASLNNKAFSPAVSLLFLLFDKKVEQGRYETLKTTIICANPLFIRWRSTLRDALRFEQIAAFENEAVLFRADVVRLQALYDPDPTPDLHCHPAGTKSWSMGAGCAVARARAIMRSTDASPADAFAARLYLQQRATALAPELSGVQAEAAATRTLAASDPGPAVDAFIKAHRALRAAVVANDGQFSALESSADDLNKATSALKTALKPAAVAPKSSSKQ